MNQLDDSFRELAEKEAARRVAGKLRRVEKTGVKQYDSIGRKFTERPLRKLPTRLELLTRLQCKTTRVESGCIEWQGCISCDGYGKSNFGGETLAHRIMWRVQVSDIPTGLEVLHRCDNPRCVNVEHLFLGTQADNNRDCAKKERHCRKISFEDAQFIRNYSDEHRFPKGRIKPGVIVFLSNKYSIARRTVQSVIRHQTWNR